MTCPIVQMLVPFPALSDACSPCGQLQAGTPQGVVSRSEAARDRDEAWRVHPRVMGKTTSEWWNAESIEAFGYQN